MYAADEQLSLEAIFAKALAGESLEENEVSFFKTNVLVELMKLYHEHGWTMQLHVHAYRNCNQRMFERLGPDTGYDGINDQPLTQSLQKLLNVADALDHLPQTILDSLYRDWETDRKSTRLNSSHEIPSRMQSSA